MKGLLLLLSLVALTSCSPTSAIKKGTWIQVLLSVPESFGDTAITRYVEGKVIEVTQMGVLIESPSKDRPDIFIPWTSAVQVKILTLRNR
jgi:hypothetical protein